MAGIDYDNFRVSLREAARRQLERFSEATDDNRRLLAAAAARLCIPFFLEFASYRESEPKELVDLIRALVAEIWDAATSTSDLPAERLLLARALAQVHAEVDPKTAEYYIACYFSLLAAAAEATSGDSVQGAYRASGEATNLVECAAALVSKAPEQEETVREYELRVLDSCLEGATAADIERQLSQSQLPQYTKDMRVSMFGSWIEDPTSDCPLCGSKLPKGTTRCWATGCSFKLPDRHYSGGGR